MAEAQPGFRDFEHVRAWLRQFDRPSVAQSRDWVTVDMLALMGQAVRVVAEEVAALKAIRSGSERTGPANEASSTAMERG